MKIVVASKDIMVMTLISQELEYHGYNPVGVNSFDEMVQELGNEARAIVVDAYMIDKAENSAKFAIINKRALEKKFPIVYVGDSDLEEQREIAFEGGAMTFIKISLIRDELVFNLDSVLRPERRFKNFKAVVVDDTEDALELLAEQLQNAGVGVLKFNNAFDAYEAVKEHRHSLDLIITDQKMEGMTGVEFCQKAKMELGLRNITVIFITGYADKENILSLYQAGASDHLIKPYFQEELWSKVKVHLKKQQRMRKLLRNINEKEQMDNLKSEFFAVSSYNLNTPLNLITGHAEILKDMVNEDVVGTVDKILKNSLSLGEMIDELQGLTRFLNSNVSDVNMDRVCIGEVVSKVIEKIKPQFEKESIGVEFISDVSSDECIKGNRVALSHAVLSVMTTAARFINANEIVKVLVSKLDDRYIGVKVIAPKHEKVDKIIDCLFNAMYRTQKEEKCGVAGFYIAKNIVEIHQGIFLYHKNSDGSEATAEMILPIK